MDDLTMDDVPPDRLAYIAQWRNGGLLAAHALLYREKIIVPRVGLSPGWWRQ
jgi:hypothetical protein